MAASGDLSTLRTALRDAAAAQMQTDAGHDLAHLDRVWVTAQDIAAHEAGVARPVLLAGCYLHDLVNLPKSSPDRAQASRMSAQAAVPLLRGFGFFDADLAAAVHVIEAHSFSAGIAPQTPEAAILRDADRLDALGAIGLARWFAVSAAMGTALYDPDDPFASARDLDDRRYALDHWQVKLGRLSQGMLTARGRQLATARRAGMVVVLRDLAAEIGADLPEDWARGPE